MNSMSSEFSNIIVDADLFKVPNFNQILKLVDAQDHIKHDLFTKFGLNGEELYDRFKYKEDYVKNVVLETKIEYSMKEFLDILREKESDVCNRIIDDASNILKIYKIINYQDSNPAISPKALNTYVMQEVLDKNNKKTVVYKKVSSENANKMIAMNFVEETTPLDAISDEFANILIDTDFLQLPRVTKLLRLIDKTDEQVKKEIVYDLYSLNANTKRHVLINGFFEPKDKITVKPLLDVLFKHAKDVCFKICMDEKQILDNYNLMIWEKSSPREKVLKIFKSSRTSIVKNYTKVKRLCSKLKSYLI